MWANQFVEEVLVHAEVGGGRAEAQEARHPGDVAAISHADVGSGFPRVAVYDETRAINDKSRAAAFGLIACVCSRFHAFAPHRDIAETKSVRAASVSRTALVRALVNVSRCRTYSCCERGRVRSAARRNASECVAVRLFATSCTIDSTCTIGRM